MQFDNRALRNLPIDPKRENRPRQVFGACFSRVNPTPVPAPRTLAVAEEVAALLDLSPEFTQSASFAEVFAGNRTLPGMDPVAACYGGHQFGTWAGQLGDGRAISLGEVRNARGEYWEVQLKGAGPTPYSRRADGRAVLRSSIREFLCSEAMHYLGIPTTRALCLIGTGDRVVRDILYDGHPRAEPGAIVCRVAASFLRFGNFEIFAHRDELDVLQRLAEHTVRTYYPALGEPSKQVYAAWFGEVCRRTAELVASWVSVGFVHGVLNTDNMSILGLTIDYGPFGFLDDFDPAFTPNITDAAGRRYRYENQPRIALWNLAKLASAIHPLVEDPEALEAGLRGYLQTYDAAREKNLAEKLGVLGLREDEVSPDGKPRVPDSKWIEALFDGMAAAEVDYTLFFRALANVPVGKATVTEEELLSAVSGAYYAFDEVAALEKQRMGAWLRSYVSRVREDSRSDAERKAAMDRVNPKFVLRNYLLQQVIDRAEEGDASGVAELLEVMRHPFDEQPGRESFAEKRPDWARNRAGCSMLSCSS